MKIDRVKAKKVFDDYVKNYNSNDEKIKLKIDHTYRVSDLCEKIALSLGMNNEDVDIAWLTGLLHIHPIQQMHGFARRCLGSLSMAIRWHHSRKSRFPFSPVLAALRASPLIGTLTSCLFALPFVPACCRRRCRYPSRSRARNTWARRRHARAANRGCRHLR